MYIRRKVFSNAGYGYEPVEDVYNVTMTGDEVRLFSELQERMYAKKSAGLPDEFFTTLKNGKKVVKPEYKSMVEQISQLGAETGTAAAKKEMIEKIQKSLVDNGYNAKEAKAIAEKQVRAGFDKANPGIFTRAGQSIKEGYNKSIGWIKKNPKLAAAAGIGTLGLGGGAYYLGSRD